MANKWLRCLKNVKFKTIKMNKLTIIISADFESILVPEDDGNQNKDDSIYKQILRHTVCSYGYKLVCDDAKFRKVFQSYLGEDVVYNFINGIIK